MESSKDLRELLSYLLVQHPDSLHLQFDAEGWTSIEQLILAAQQMGSPLDQSALEAATSQGQAGFAISDDGRRIRALPDAHKAKPAHPPAESPPSNLYYPTSTRLLGAIHTHGLRSRSGQLLHLFDDPEVANSLAPAVAERVIVSVQSGRMEERGYLFWRGDNDVWLTESVPPEFLL